MKPTVIKLNQQPIRIRKKKRSVFPTIIKSVVGGIFVIVLGTIGIDAADHYGNISDSIVGRVIFGKQERCPSDMVYVPSDNGGFCIDRYENSPSGKCTNLQPANLSDTQVNIDDQNCKAVSVPNATPWVNISQDQAIRVCAKSGKRLPNNQEWSAAALGTPDNLSSWGAGDCQVDKNWSDQPGLSGSGKSCVSYAGANDMIGNVWEWVNGAITDGEYNGRKLPDSGYVQAVNANDSLPSETGSTPNKNMYDDNFWIKNTGTRGILRGGYWDSRTDAGQYSVYAVEYPRSYGATIGFRCVK